MAARRERLLAAGLERFGTHGFAASSVKSVCVEAGLSERYFYESFSDREDLLHAVYERIVEEVMSASVSAAEAASPMLLERARAGLHAFFDVLTGDRRKGRVLALEVVGVSERLERRRRRTMHDFAAYIAATGLALAHAELRPALDVRLTALMLVGGTNELLIEWLLDDGSQDAGSLAEHCANAFAAMFDAIAGTAG